VEWDPRGSKAILKVAKNNNRQLKRVKDVKMERPAKKILKKDRKDDAQENKPN